MKAHLADAHLTYIAWGAGHYDVYPAGGGHLLGWVVKDGSLWRASGDDPTVDDVLGRTRWETATALWGLSL